MVENTRSRSVNLVSAYDAALDSGNQWVLQLITRYEEYKSFIGGNIDGDIQTLCTIPEAISVKEVYEDYTEWSQSKKYSHLQILHHQLKVEEGHIKRAIGLLRVNHESNIAKSRHIREQLRNKEHELCKKIWKAMKSERIVRGQLAVLSDNVVGEKKQQRHRKHDTVRWQSELQMRRGAEDGEWRSVQGTVLRGVLRIACEMKCLSINSNTGPSLYSGSDRFSFPSLSSLSCSAAYPTSPSSSYPTNLHSIPNSTPAHALAGSDIENTVDKSPNPLPRRSRSCCDLHVMSSPGSMTAPLTAARKTNTHTASLTFFDIDITRITKIEVTTAVPTAVFDRLGASTFSQATSKSMTLASGAVDEIRITFSPDDLSQPLIDDSTLLEPYSVFLSPSLSPSLSSSFSSSSSQPSSRPPPLATSASFSTSQSITMRLPGSYAKGSLTEETVRLISSILSIACTSPSFKGTPPVHVLVDNLPYAHRDYNLQGNQKQSTVHAFNGAGSSYSFSGVASVKDDCFKGRADLEDKNDEAVGDNVDDAKNATICLPDESISINTDDITSSAASSVMEASGERERQAKERDSALADARDCVVDDGPLFDSIGALQNGRVVSFSEMHSSDISCGINISDNSEHVVASTRHRPKTVKPAQSPSSVSHSLSSGRTSFDTSSSSSLLSYPYHVGSDKTPGSGAYDQEACSASTGLSLPTSEYTILQSAVRDSDFAANSNDSTSCCVSSSGSNGTSSNGSGGPIDGTGESTVACPLGRIREESREESSTSSGSRIAQLVTADINHFEQEQANSSDDTDSENSPIRDSLIYSPMYSPICSPNQSPMLGLDSFDKHRARSPDKNAEGGPSSRSVMCSSEDNLRTNLVWRGLASTYGVFPLAHTEGEAYTIGTNEDRTGDRDLSSSPSNRLALADARHKRFICERKLLQVIGIRESLLEKLRYLQGLRAMLVEVDGPVPPASPSSNIDREDEAEDRNRDKDAHTHGLGKAVKAVLANEWFSGDQVDQDPIRSRNKEKDRKEGDGERVVSNRESIPGDIEGAVAGHADDEKKPRNRSSQRRQSTSGMLCTSLSSISTAFRSSSTCSEAESDPPSSHSSRALSPAPHSTRSRSRSRTVSTRTASTHTTHATSISVSVSLSVSSVTEDIHECKDSTHFRGSGSSSGSCSSGRRKSSCFYSCRPDGLPLYFSEPSLLVLSETISSISHHLSFQHQHQRDQGKKTAVSTIIPNRPLPECECEYKQVKGHLEEIWRCGMEAHRLVIKLARCLVSMDRTEQRLAVLAESGVSADEAAAKGLYDIELC